MDLKFRLINQGISLENAMDHIAQYSQPDQNGDEENKVISIQTMLQILNTAPFGIESLEESLQLARYLIEENGEAYIEFNYENSETLSVVFSIFKKTLCNYKLDEATNEEEKHVFVAKFLEKH